MGIKMTVAIDGNGMEWEATAYVKGLGKEPLRCFHCSTTVTHRMAHAQERDKKTVLMPAYFRLMPNGRHAYDCKYAIEDKMKIIADDSNGLIEGVRKGEYRLRLSMVKNALVSVGSTKKTGYNNKYNRTGVAYLSSGNKLPAFLNSAKKVLLLRALCDSDDEIASHLQLVFEGRSIIPWAQFYFETDRYMQAYQQAANNTAKYPIAIHGSLRSDPKLVPTKVGQMSMLSLDKPQTYVDPNTPGNRLSVDVSVWCQIADWVQGLKKNDEVVLLGMWKATAGNIEQNPNLDKYPCKSFQTHKLSLWPVLMTQIVKVPVRVS